VPFVHIKNTTVKTKMSPAQCRAARALIQWSQDQLAAASKVAKATIANFESRKRAPYARTLDDLREALEAEGVEFIAENGGGPGVRLVKNKTTASRSKAVSKASELAGHQIDRMGDESATEEQRAARKRRLIKGPKEFREIRGDRPK